ncbi:MAG: DUF63 family protein [Candidatus Micrarchaeota archaeon]|nr:DUF63 family protein [Candidatus Micrarchaeota archaeon]
MQNIQNFIENYFIKPILNYEGYNLVNTATYAVIAILAVYAIYVFFKKRKIQIDNNFFYGVISFVFFGSLFRVCVDGFDNFLGDNFLTNFVLEHKIFEYSLVTTSPVIYVSTAILFFLSYYLERELKIQKFSFLSGILLSMICLFFLFPLIKYIDVFFLILTVALCYSFILMLLAKIKDKKFYLLLFSHCLDGASTWVAIDIVPKKYGLIYGEQHVVPNIIASLVPELGFATFFIIKGLIALLALKIIEKEEDKNLSQIVLLALIVIGLAPGIRDLIRVSAGV